MFSRINSYLFHTTKQICNQTFKYSNIRHLGHEQLYLKHTRRHIAMNSKCGLLNNVCNINDFNYSRLRWVHVSATVHVSFKQGPKIDKEEEKRLIQHGYFRTDKQNKENFLMTLRVYTEHEKMLRGHVEFIQSALKNMEEFGVHKDLEVYKKLMGVFPKVKMIAQTMWQEEFQHYPIQQDCATDILCQMEYWGILPDSEMENIIMTIFGKNSTPMKKMLRMNYWMHKFNNASPWPLPKPVPNDALELAKLAVAQMCSVDQVSEISIFDTKEVEDAIDLTWIVSGQSIHQIELLDKQPDDKPLKVEGPTKIFLREECINYFVLKADYRPGPEIPEIDKDDIGIIQSLLKDDATLRTGTSITVRPSVHEQKDGTILAICVTGTSSRDSLLSWIRLLGESNPKLNKTLSVVFLQASPEEEGELTVIGQSYDEEENKQRLHSGSSEENTSQDDKQKDR